MVFNEEIENLKKVKKSFKKDAPDSLRRDVIDAKVDDAQDSCTDDHVVWTLRRAMLRFLSRLDYSLLCSPSSLSLFCLSFAFLSFPSFLRSS